MQRIAILIVELLLTIFIFACFGLWLARWGYGTADSTRITLAGAISGGVIGNFADRLMCRGASYVASMLALTAPPRLPPNHDVVRSLWIAQLSAAALIATRSIALERQGMAACDRSSWAYHYALDDLSA